MTKHETTQQKKLIQHLEDEQQKEFDNHGKSDYFLYLEDVIGEAKELWDAWDQL